MNKNQSYLKAGFKHCQIRIPVMLHDKVRKEAEKQDCSVSLCIVNMIEDWLTDYEGRQTLDQKIDNILDIVSGYEFEKVNKHE